MGPTRNPISSLNSIQLEQMVAMQMANLPSSSQQMAQPVTIKTDGNGGNIESANDPQQQTGTPPRTPRQQLAQQQLAEQRIGTTTICTATTSAASSNTSHSTGSSNIQSSPTNNNNNFLKEWHQRNSSNNYHSALNQQQHLQALAPAHQWQQQQPVIQQQEFLQELAPQQQLQQPQSAHWQQPAALAPICGTATASRIGTIPRQAALCADGCSGKWHILQNGISSDIGTFPSQFMCSQQ
jgi:hypothetical protein